MMRSYLGLSLSLCLMFAVGCGDDDGGDGGSGGTAATGGAGGASGAGGTGGPPPSGGMQTKDISFGCSNSATTNISILPGTLTVDSDDIVGGAEFDATLSGIVVFPESFLDVGQALVPGGFRSAELIDGQAIVQVRSGATEVSGAGGAGGAGGGPPGVALGPDLDALTPGFVSLCALAPPDGACDLANNECNTPEMNGTGDACTSDDDCTMVGENCFNTDCPPFFVTPQMVVNTCVGQILVDLTVQDGTPGSEGGCTSPGAFMPVPDCDCSACDALDPPDCAPDDCAKADQCNFNGFCVAEPLALPLAAATQKYLADASGGSALFGWADQGLPGITEAMGIYTIPQPTFSDPAVQGLRVDAGGLNVAIECTMAIDGGNDDAAETPDEDLIPYTIP